MRYLPISQVSEGMVLGRTVFDAAGNPLLTEGTRLTSAYVDRLRELGYPALYIRSALEPETFDFAEPVRQETRLKAQAVLRELAADLADKGITPKRLEAAQGLVAEMVDELLGQDELVLSVMEIRSLDSYTFSHSVNTCILSVMAGISLGLDRSRLIDLGVGALLHDLGKIFVPREILTKPGPLTVEEFSQVQTHCRRGYNLLRDQVNLLSAHVAYQHHERADGSGYPRGLRRDEMILFARIAAVADSFDAMTSNRVYSQALLPDHAIGVLFRETPARYDFECVRALARYVAAYPIGSVVRLESGESGEVVNVTRAETYVLVTRGSRRGQVVCCPREATIAGRVSWPGQN
ncbi:MAG TPA: HD-GYP domain-containing protein [Firmicutes bacterium]|nr:HD-GYP domain-containing protein [Bacillota bacterium]